MRLQGVQDETVYATAGRRVLRRTGAGTFDRLGRLPAASGRLDQLGTRALSAPGLGRLAARLVGAVATVNVWPLSGTDLLGCVGRTLSVSADGGRRWEHTHQLPASSGPMGVLPPAVAQQDGLTYLGEYPLASGATPRVLRSGDLGRSWATELALPDVRHIHAVQCDPYGGDLWLTTGDTDAESRIGRVRDGSFVPVGGGSQRWRAVELAFTPDAILWGMDCSYADENHVLKLPRSELGTHSPAVRTVHTVPGSVYYAATPTIAGETWVVFSTAMEAGRDSTGPDDQTARSGRGVVVAASASTGYSKWHEIGAFQRRRCVADHLPASLPRANGYVFLGEDPAGGVLVNPFNTTLRHGDIYDIDLTPEAPHRPIA